MINLCLLHTCLVPSFPPPQPLGTMCDSRAGEDVGYCTLLLFLQNLEDRMGALEEGGFNPKEPEPILTCVQCSAEYKESENAGQTVWGIDIT